MEMLIIALGLLMLGFGRKLFWLFVGAAGFLAGMEVGAVILMDQPFWIMMIAALGAGLIGIVLAIFLQRFAFALAGFYGAGYLVLMTTHSLPDVMSLSLAAAGGVLGAVIAVLITDRAIIVFSSLVGAGAIVVGLSRDGPLAVAVFIILAAAGILFQSRVLSKKTGSS